MGLRDRLSRSGTPVLVPESAPAAVTPPPLARSIEELGRRSARYQQIKFTLHQRLIDQIDLAKLPTSDSPAARRQIRELLERLIEEDNPPLSQEERSQLLEDLEHETFGLGPIEPLLRDPTIDDVLVNRYDDVYVERFGRLQKTDIMFRDNAHLLQVIERIVSKVGRRIDESSPMVDARLPDGSRVNAIIPPLSVDGCALSIRRSKQQPMAIDDLLRLGSMDRLIASLLEAVVKARLNVLISGGSGSGKTTLLNALIGYIGQSERIVSIEDTVELRPRGLHIVRLETRPPNIEGQGEVTQRDLVRNALRMRPDRIIVGEVRGAEALDMLQAMNTGHKGSLTTIHANSPRDALARLETMILLAGVNLTSEAMRRQISSAIDLIIQLNRFHDGTRRVVSICEVVGMEEQIVKLQEIVKYEQSKNATGDGVRGDYVSTGVLPVFLEDLQRSGVPVPIQFFQSGQARLSGRG